jgi:ABC-2 type transport system ATP-binding protein
MNLSPECTMPEPALRFESVTFRYSTAEVLHGVSFHLQPGQVVGLLGPNGAGKSTTLKIAAGMLTPASGSVSVAGLPLPARAVDVKQRVGYVPETAVLFDSLSGQEFLELCGRLHDVPEDLLQSRIRDILETFGLTSDRVSRLDAYSKGMRQKILIAAALLHSPDLILLDEPLSGLDVNAAMLIKDLIAALAAQGKAVLYSSHVLDVVERVCDRVLIIYEGRLVADGPALALMEQTGETSLEGAFRRLTCAAIDQGGIARIVEALRP